MPPHPDSTADNSTWLTIVPKEAALFVRAVGEKRGGSKAKDARDKVLGCESVGD
jgi:hypothetical protein